MINIAIYDDDISVAKEIEELIKSIVNTEVYNITIFDNGDDFLKSDLKKYEMVFLDIEIGNISGIDIAVRLRNINKIAIIFFITNHFRYISEALKSMPFQYILKPISQQKDFFIDEFKRGINKLKKSKHSMLVKTYYGEELIKVGSILYIECLNRKVDIHTKDKVISCTGKLQELIDKLLPYDFIQCHNSYLVNLKYIVQIKHNVLMLNNGMSLPISRRFLHSTRDSRDKYLAGVNI